MKGRSMEEFQTLCRSAIVIWIWNGFSALGAVYHSDGSAASVQGLQDQVLNGDTITIPAGTFTWTTRVNLTKGITLQGAGSGSTTIVHNLPTVNPVLVLTGNSDFPRVTGITFTSVNPANTATAGIIKVATGINNRFRIDNCRFVKPMTTGISVYDSYGVIDHCYLDTDTHGTGIAIFGGRDNSWNRPLSLGTDKATYIEDCQFVWPSNANGAIDQYNGSRVVFRHNTVTNTTFGGHGLDSGGYRSALSSEIYENTVNLTLATARICQVRGGTGVWFNNTVNLSGSGSLAAFTQFQCYRATGTCILPSYVPWGFVTGSNHYDGNTDVYGYPALDQVGACPPTDPPNVSAVPPASHSTQGHQAAYVWNNIKNPGNTVMRATISGCSGACCPDGSPGHPNVANIIQAGRDFINNTPMPGYVPYTYPHPLVTDPPVPSPTPSATVTPSPTATPRHHRRHH